MTHCVLMVPRYVLLPHLCQFPMQYQTLALLYITLGMILVGGLGIFSLSSVHLGDALWEAVVGVGIDWTFPSDSNPEDHDSGAQVLAVRFMGLLVSIGGEHNSTRSSSSLSAHPFHSSPFGTTTCYLDL